MQDRLPVPQDLYSSFPQLHRPPKIPLLLMPRYRDHFNLASCSIRELSRQLTKSKVSDVAFAVCTLTRREGLLDFGFRVLLANDALD